MKRCRWSALLECDIERSRQKKSIAIELGKHLASARSSEALDLPGTITPHLLLYMALLSCFIEQPSGDYQIGCYTALDTKHPPPNTADGWSNEVLQVAWPAARLSSPPRAAISRSAIALLMLLQTSSLSCKVFLSRMSALFLSLFPIWTSQLALSVFSESRSSSRSLSIRSNAFAKKWNRHLWSSYRRSSRLGILVVY